MPGALAPRGMVTRSRSYKHLIRWFCPRTGGGEAPTRLSASRI